MHKSESERLDSCIAHVAGCSCPRVMGQTLDEVVSLKTLV